MPATLRRGRSAGASPHGRSSSSSSYRTAINAPPATNASPAAALDPALATVLAQPALLVALLAQLLQQAAPSAPSASALPLAVVPPPAYDVHTPPSLPPHGDGLAPTHIRHVASLDFNGDDPKRTVNDFLTQFEMFCTINRAAFPVATASPYLIGDASRWFHSVYQGRSVFDITWGEFSSAMLSSPLVDIMASQRLLDEYKMQAQRSSSIKDYITDAYKMYSLKSSHNWLRTYPEHFFVESFSHGLDPEIKSRLPKIENSTTFTEYTQLALNVGVPLEAAARTKTPAPRPAANLDEASSAETDDAATDPSSDMSDREIANYERTSLSKEDRRASRLARGACTYCGDVRHAAGSCPAALRKDANSRA
mmetsp:Transcript_54209/g.128765  ORF Transcript_54209/g.128765 Transcript_54209/m.128765 type:complete len:366 (-) Transcript_54209:218-1315(-)